MNRVDGQRRASGEGSEAVGVRRAGLTFPSRSVASLALASLALACGPKVIQVPIKTPPKPASTEWKPSYPASRAFPDLTPTEWAQMPSPIAGAAADLFADPLRDPHGPSLVPHWPRPADRRMAAGGRAAARRTHAARRRGSEARERRVDRDEGDHEPQRAGADGRLGTGAGVSSHRSLSVRSAPCRGEGRIEVGVARRARSCTGRDPASSRAATT